MAYNPVSGAAIQYSNDKGKNASDYWLKFYIANTTTPLSMATDSTGGTLLAKCKLNDEGYPISNENDNDTIFIPHVDQAYRWVTYRTEAEADANDTASAQVNIPAVNSLVGTATPIVEYIDSVEDLSGLVGTVDGQQISVLGWHPDSDVGGGTLYFDESRDKSDHNGGTIFSPTVPWTTTTADYLNAVGETDPGGTGCWVHVDVGYVTPHMFGAVGDGITDDLPSAQAALYTRFANGRSFDPETSVTIKAFGDFKCSDVLFIPPNAKLIGTGGQFTRFLFDAGSSGLVGFDNFTNGDTGHPDYVGGGTQYFSIENIWVDSPDQTATKRGIDFDEVYFGSIKDCLVSGFDEGCYYKGQVAEVLNTRLSNWATTGLNAQGQSMLFNTVTIEKPFNHAVSIAGTTGVIIGGVATTNAMVLNNLHVEDMERGVDIVDADGVVISGIRCSNGTSATGADCILLQSGSLVLNGLSSFNYTNQITNTNDTGMNITGLNYTPFWTYGANGVSGKYDILFDLVKSLGGSAGGFRIGETASLIGQDAQGNLELAFGITGSVKQLQVKPGGGATTLFMDQNGDLITTGGISGNGATFSRNLANKETVTAATTSKAVVFPKSEPNSNYKVTLTPNWDTTCWLTSIAIGGFTANFGTAAPSGAEVHWHLIG